MIHFHVKFKFRAFGHDWGKIDQTGSFMLFPGLPLPDADAVVYNQHGGYVRLATKPINP